MAKSINEILLHWRIKADNDFTVAEKELKSKSPVTDAVCFHCQQAAEKYLKLFLVYNGIEPKKTHLISDLIIECSKIDTDFEKLSQSAYLSDYAVELRYPDDFYIPDLEETKEAFESAKMIKNFVLNRINIH